LIARARAVLHRTCRQRSVQHLAFIEKPVHIKPSNTPWFTLRQRPTLKLEVSIARFDDISGHRVRRL
jgi:hypothetical protein